MNKLCYSLQPCTTEDTHHWRSKVGEDCSSPPCLLITAVQQPGTSGPPSRLKHSSEGVIWMCRASSFCSLPWSSTVVSSQWIRWWFSQPCSATAKFSIILLSQASHAVFLQSRLHSPSGLSDVDLAAAAGDTIHHIGLLTKK